MRSVTLALIGAHALNLCGLASTANIEAGTAGEWSFLAAAVFEHGRVGRWFVAAVLACCAGVAALHVPRGRRWLWWSAALGGASLATAVIELPSTLAPTATVNIQLLQMTIAATALGALLQSARRSAIPMNGNALQSMRIAIALPAVTGLVIAAGVAAAVFDASPTTAHLFDLNGEGNVASWFSSVLLAGAAVACALMTPFDRRRAVRRLWIVLTALFAFVSFDEYASLHELPIVEFVERQNLGWILTLSWAALLSAVAGVVALLCISGLLRLRRRTAARMIVCGAVYLSGAIGLELLGGWWFDAHGADAFHTAALCAEESLEMLGVAAFIIVVCAELRAAEICYVFGPRRDDQPLAHVIELAEAPLRSRAA